jgi:hypothetical protein
VDGHPVSAPTLPPALARWAGTLSVLDPALAVALGPMVRALDELVRRGDDTSAGAGEPDGYGGLSRRGDPHRILTSEWALALDLPLEFLRRAAEGELLHLEPARRQERPRGRVVALVDCGPGQLGAARLVQLAALVVLHRRAAARGSELRLGILGDEPGRWRDGEPRVVLDAWLRSRRPAEPRPEDVAALTADLDRADEAWLLTGPELAAGRRRAIVAAESAWSATGATAVGVVVDGRRAELALPPAAVAVRALRGAAVPRPWGVDGPGDVRDLAFPSADPVLLARGRYDELVRIRVPAPGARPSRLKRHAYPGPVLTATVIGNRTVALVGRGDDVTVEVRGKHLGRVDGITVPAAALGLTRDDVAGLAAGPLTPLLYDSGHLLVRLGDRWWRLHPDGPPEPADDVLATLPRPQADRPRVARRDGIHTVVEPDGWLALLPAELLLGPGRLVAFQHGGGWFAETVDTPIRVGPGEKILGLHRIQGEPTLVTVSAAGVLVRLRWPGGERTLTAWSVGVEPPAVHPTRPWIAVRREDGVVVGDLVTGQKLLDLAGPG